MHATPACCSEQVKLTAWLKPYSGVSVSVRSAGVRADISTEDVDVVKAKS